MTAADRPTFDDDDEIFDRLHSHKDIDFVSDKLGRELYVMVGGTADAAISAFSKEHVAETMTEGTGAVLAGVALKAAEAKIPALRPAIAAVGLATSFSFAKDLVGNFGQISTTFGDVWKNEDHCEEARKNFAEHGGKFVFDLALTGGAGLAGSAIGERAMFGSGSNFVRIPTYDGVGLMGRSGLPHDRLYSKDDAISQLVNNAKPSTLALYSSNSSGFSRGNAFLVSDDGLAVTNYHCINGKKALSVTDFQGIRYKATVLNADQPNDLALLRVVPNSADTKFKPLALAEKNANPEDSLYVLSRQPVSSGLTLSPGKLQDVHTLNVSVQMPVSSPGRKGGITLGAFSREVKCPPPVNLSDLAQTERMAANYFSKSGMSGSAVLSEKGEVVGIHKGSLGSWWGQLTGRNTAVPVSAIHDLLRESS